MKYLLLCFFSVLPVIGVAHEPVDHYDRVQLSASAQTQVDNDTVIAVMYSQEEGGDAVQLTGLVNERVTKAVELLQQHESIKFQTSAYSTSPVYHKNKVTGWRVRQTLRLESKDMALMSKVVGQMQQTLALQRLSFTVSPELKKKTDDQLIDEALIGFQQRALRITQQLGRKNYKIVDIDVSTSTGHYPRPQFEAAVMASKAAAPAIEAGEQTLQVRVSGQIEME